MPKQTLKLPASTQKLIRHYKNLHIQGITVVCPYHVNTRLHSTDIALAGKGKPEQIEQAADKYLTHYDLNAKGNPEALRLYMTACGIGVDCSGFAVWVIDSILKEKSGKGIGGYIKYPNIQRRASGFLRPIANISANTITSPRNTVEIADLREVRPGDLVRASNGGHVMVITEVKTDKSGNAIELEYTHSTIQFGGGNGVVSGMVKITSPLKSLYEQKWEDTFTQKSYAESGNPMELVRLKVLA